MVGKATVGEKGFWLGVGASGLLVGYYLLVGHFQALVIRPTYTIVPDPYMLIAAAFLLGIFAYRQRALFAGLGRDGLIKWFVILMSVSVLALSAAGVVREVGYRLPGVRILLDWEQYAAVRLTQYFEARDRWCPSRRDDCMERAESFFDAEMLAFDARVSEGIVRHHLPKFMFVEGAAFLAMIAAFLGLHRLVMSGRLGQSRYHYIRLFNRYGAEP